MVSGTNSLALSKTFTGASTTINFHQRPDWLNQQWNASKTVERTIRTGYPAQRRIRTVRRRMASRAGGFSRLWKQQHNFFEGIYGETMSREPLNILIAKRPMQTSRPPTIKSSRKFGKNYADKFRSNIIDLFQKLAITPTAAALLKITAHFVSSFSTRRTKRFIKQQKLML